MPIATTYQDLTAFQLADGGIQFTGIETFDEPGAFIGLVSYTEAGVDGVEPLRLDFGKICFLDIAPFEAAYGEAEGRTRANVLAHRLMELLAEPQTTNAAYGD